MRFSERSRLVIASFLRSAGLGSVFSDDGSCSVIFDQSGLFELVPMDRSGMIWISLSWKPALETEEAKQRLLQAAGSDTEIFPVLIHSGIAVDGSFVLAVNVEESVFDEPLINNVLARLLNIRWLV